MAKKPTPLLDRIRMNSVDEGDCWLWEGYMSRNNTPYVYAKNEQGKHVHTPARRAIAKETGKFREGYVYYAVCGEARCVNPEHVRGAPEGVARRRILDRALSGRSDLVRRQKITKARQTTYAKINMEAARDIRAWDGPARVKAEQYGISKSMVDRIRRGQAWVESAPNPFAGLF